MYCSKDFVTGHAMTDAEMDAQVREAKADLDAAAERAKLAVKKHLFHGRH